MSVRTVQHWESGTTRIPYAAFKLMRVMRGGKLLGSDWHGFIIRGDKLITPEGHEFRSSDLAWWSLLVRRAREYGNARRQLRELQDLMGSLQGNGASATVARGELPASHQPVSASTVPHCGHAGPSASGASAGLVSFSNKVETLLADVDLEAENKAFHDQPLSTVHSLLPINSHDSVRLQGGAA